MGLKRRRRMPGRPRPVFRVAAPGEQTWTDQHGKSQGGFEFHWDSPDDVPILGAWHLSIIGKSTRARKEFGRA
jgi:hypothetical protein